MKNTRKLIMAVIENYDGLPEEVVAEMKRRFYVPGNLLWVKKIEFEGNSYKVGVDIEVLGEGTIFMVNANNVRLYEQYDEDFKYYDPMKDEELRAHKQKGEEE